MKLKFYSLSVIIIVFFVLSSCSSDNVLTGTYYLKHDNSVEEYMIVKPDSTYSQFLLNNDQITTIENKYYQYGSGYMFKNYINGFDPPFADHESNKASYNLLGVFTSNVSGKKQLIIEYNMDIYLTKISQSINSDSLLRVIKTNL